MGSRELEEIYFLDTYHLHFHSDVPLPTLHQRLTVEGRVFVLDRIANKQLSRREASHRRMIAPETVQKGNAWLPISIHPSNACRSSAVRSLIRLLSCETIASAKLRFVCCNSMIFSSTVSVQIIR